MPNYWLARPRGIRFPRRHDQFQLGDRLETHDGDPAVSGDVVEQDVWKRVSPRRGKSGWSI